MCHKTCRALRPDEPETWCDGCHHDEAVDREEQMLRWHRDNDHREAIQRWTARFAEQEEAERELAPPA